MTTSRYVHGLCPTLVHDNTVIMISGGDSALCEDLWQIVTREHWEIVDVIDRLAVSGLADLPDFALVTSQGQERTVLVRGGFQVTIASESAEQQVSGEAVSIWREVNVPLAGTDRVTVAALEEDETEGLSRPIARGVVEASTVVLGLEHPGGGTGTLGASEPVSDVALVNPGVVESADEGIAESGSAPAVAQIKDSEPGEKLDSEPELEDVSELVPELEGVPESELEAVQEPESEFGADPEPDFESEHGADPEPELGLEDEPATESESEIEADLDAQADPNATLGEAESISTFDAMFGRTIAGRRLEDAAVREPEGAAAPAIAGLPGLSLVPDIEAADAPAGDHAGDTVSAAALAQLRVERQTPRATPQAPTRTQVKATLTLSTGKVVELERPAIFGRSPRAHGSTSADLPQLVIIDNPYVSGSHLMVAIEDDIVVATDMSTNGTLITRPGAAPVRLVKGEATTISDGCVLALTADISATVSVAAGGTQ